MTLTPLKRHWAIENILEKSAQSGPSGKEVEKWRRG
jgi:hypothetical protein